MNKGVSLQLDSYRLAQYAVQVPCYICEQGNTFDAELCRNCCAPMALAHQSAAQKVAPQILAAIGSSGAGKTVYLGMLLELLSRQPEPLQVLARGAFSITLQQTTSSALARCEFPTKTPNEPDRWNWMHCQVRTVKHRRPLELIMPDVAGETLFEEIEHPRSCLAIQAVLDRAGGILLLVDAAQVRDGNVDQDYFAMKLASYLSELNSPGKRNWADRPVAIVFTKADQSEECLDDPAAYARARTPGLWQHCQTRFHQHQFFAATVAGACAYRKVPGEAGSPVPLRIEPRGIVEPFQWIVDRLRP